MGGWVLCVHFSFHRHLIEYKIVFIVFNHWGSLCEQIKAVFH